MKEIKVGLTNNKTSFWDPNTNSYITLDRPVQKIAFDEERPDIARYLERICHACFASNPSLKLYEGEIPQVAVDAWKSKYDLEGLNIAKRRADRLIYESAKVVTDDKEEAPEEPEIPEPEEPEQPDPVEPEEPGETTPEEEEEDVIEAKAIPTKDEKVVKPKAKTASKSKKKTEK